MKTAVACLALVLACGCEVLKPAVAPHPKNYSLADARTAVPALQRGATKTLIVNPPHAASGFDSEHIIYMRQASQLEYFAHSEWVDTPARMLAPLIVAALENSGAFRAVVPVPSNAAGDMRLDTEVLRLQHEFLSTPSRVRFTLRAYLLDTATRRVLASREFEAVVPATSDDAYGGVVAAIEAVRKVLEELAAFCADVAR